jgi:hypothetical protein
MKLKEKTNSGNAGASNRGGFLYDWSGLSSLNGCRLFYVVYFYLTNFYFLHLNATTIVVIVVVVDSRCSSSLQNELKRDGIVNIILK